MLKLAAEDEGACPGAMKWLHASNSEEALRRLIQEHLPESSSPKITRELLRMLGRSSKVSLDIVEQLPNPNHRAHLVAEFEVLPALKRLLILIECEGKAFERALEVVQLINHSPGREALEELSKLWRGKDQWKFEQVEEIIGSRLIKLPMGMDKEDPNEVDAQTTDAPVDGQ